MKKLQNETLQKFIDNLIDTLKVEINDKGTLLKNDQLDIPFIISSLYQSFSRDDSNSIYKAFIEDLEKYSDYVLILTDINDAYNGICDLYISLIKYYNKELQLNYKMPDYDYRIRFYYDDRLYGYCECTPGMKDYREDKDCCGHGCDATFCRFQLQKILNITEDSWHGDEHDYWDFEDKFYKQEKELDDKIAEENRTREIERLKEQIKIDTKRLAELEKN